MKSLTRLKSSALAATLCVLLSGCELLGVHAIEVPAQAAERGLAVLQQVVNSNNFADLGFESAADVQRAVVEQYVPIREVGLQELRAFRDGMSLQRVLANPREWLYFVTVDGIRRSSLIVQRVGVRFEPTQIGNAGVVVRLRGLDQCRLDGYSIVQIPALNISFLAYTDRAVDMLSPLADFNIHASQPQTLWAGEPRRATEVLQLLTPMAALVSEEDAS